MNQTTYQRKETEPAAIARWLDKFLDSRGALLEPAEEPSDASPVVVREIDAEGRLLLDVGAVPFASRACESGTAVVISRFCGDEHVSTGPVRIRKYWEGEGRELALLDPPGGLLITRRRHEFRATLRRELHCRVALAVGSLLEPLYGELMNLSMGGCQVRFPLSAIHIPDADLQCCSLTLTFPNGESLALEGVVRHLDPIVERGQIVCGFAFTGIDGVRERVLWHCVCEIEREASRAAEAGRELPPSRLFLSRAREAHRDRRAEELPAPVHATAAARHLGEIGDGVGVLLHGLRRRGVFESSALSRLADRLLALHDEDRQELLFGLVCQREQTPLVRHCLGVAVRLTDVSRQLNMPRERVKAVAACALVHDLSLALDHGNDVDPRQVEKRGAETLQTVSAALRRCDWLPAPVIAETVEQVGERLDGSGAPRGLADEQIGHLGRLAAVVDVLDLRRNPGGGDPEMTFGDLRRWLLAQDRCFAHRWVDYCYSLFGPVPIGATVATEGGDLYWLRRLDGHGRCEILVPCLDAAYPSIKAIEAQRSGQDLAALGPLTELPTSR